ncbi:heme NO-binding domain-containing protein [Profundibacterium mesophilum]|nr:heme NO-binding domain-containing protein [Profundibacterium mesophilum]
MHGLFNRALQCFLRDTYGDRVWQSVRKLSALKIEEFEPMLVYDDVLTWRVLASASRLLDKPQEILLEDLGTYLVSHPTMGRVRRLLRFGGDSYVDFLHSLDDLRDRVLLAMPELEFPVLCLTQDGDGHYALCCEQLPYRLYHVALGMLRAMADDYGALVYLECSAPAPGVARSNDCAITIRLLSAQFTAGRSFDLSALQS